MTNPDTISADYTLRPSELAATLALLVEARQPAMVWGPPGSAKSMIAQQVAAVAASMSTSGRSCSTPWTCAASPGATPPTAPAGRRPSSCRRPVTPASGSSTSKSCLPACRWSRPLFTSSRSNARLANTSSPRARRSSPAARRRRARPGHGIPSGRATLTRQGGPFR